MQRAGLAEVQLLDHQVREPSSTLRFPPFLTIRLRLRRDLRAWTEAAGDLDKYVEVEGYRNVIMSHIKKLDDDSKLALSLCESPAQVVRACCT